MDKLQSSEAQLIGQMLQVLQSDARDTKVSVEEINKSLQVLTRLEAQHAETRGALQRAFDTIQKVDEKFDGKVSKHDERLQAIEIVMPGLKEMRKWVIGVALGGVTLIFLALARLVLKV